MEEYTQDTTNIRGKMKYKKYEKKEGWEKWIYCRATVLCECPKCKAPKGYECVTPSGRVTSTPHMERMVEEGRNEEAYRN